MKYLLLFSLTFVLTSCSETTFKDITDVLLSDPTTSNVLSLEEVAKGLKQALAIGAEVAGNKASQTDGFYKNQMLYIPFPEEAIKVKQTALDFGLSSQVEQFEMTLNRAAEEAAKEAAPIFLEAITSMTIEDAFGILKGGDEAATNYLKKKTTANLTALFAPKVDAAINEVKLTQYWEPLVSKYNTTTILTGAEPINADLEAYITERAISGLFVHIAEEESKIRQNPAARVTDLLQRVFGSMN
jgi:hypothetical protein